MLRRPAFAAFLLAFACAVRADDGLRAAMAAELERQSLQGAVWSTLIDGRVATGAAGVRDARSGAPLAPDDRVQVGSIAKTLLALGVLRLAGEGRLALDDEVAVRLPRIAFDNPWQATDPVRVRHLLDHTAGLDDARLAQIFSLRATADAPLLDGLRGRQPLRVRHRPGARHSYSNTGYTLLGMLIESVTGERYERWLEAHLLRPLAMHDSTFAYVTQADGADGAPGTGDPRLAMGHFEAGAAQPAVPTWLRPATQFTTTAADMARLAQFMLGDGRVDGVPIVEHALLAAMGTPAGTEAAQAGLEVGYGLGLATRDRHGAVGRCHGGNTVGYRAMFCLFPAQRRAYFIAHNADVEGADYGRFDRRLGEALRLPRVAPAPAPATHGDASGWSGYYVPSPNRFAAFAWLDATFGFVRVRVRGDGRGVALAAFGADEIALVPVAPGLYRAPDRLIASHAFVRSTGGGRVLSTGLQTWEATPGWRLALRWGSLAAGLAGAAWLLLAGSVRALRRFTAWRAQPAFPAWLGLLALAAPLPFFFAQSFLELGDVTPAGVLLALATLGLPLAMLAGIVRYARAPHRTRAMRLDVLAMFAVLQFALVLAAAGLLPLRLWA